METKLQNDAFVQRAPAAVVEDHRRRLNALNAQLAEVETGARRPELKIILCSSILAPRFSKKFLQLRRVEGSVVFLVQFEPDPTASC